MDGGLSNARRHEANSRKTASIFSLCVSVLCHFRICMTIPLHNIPSFDGLCKFDYLNPSLSLVINSFAQAHKVD